MIIRLLDFVFSLLGLVCGSPVLLAIYLVGLSDTGSPLFRQERVGRNKKPFVLVKFRTMSVDTASMASHLASTSSITQLGGFLRKTKLDELPQLWNVLKGEMSLVGPRPVCLIKRNLRKRAMQKACLPCDLVLRAWRKYLILICLRQFCWQRQMPK